MKTDEASTISQIDKLGLRMQQKLIPADSIFEHIFTTLKTIQKDKTGSNEAIGAEFANLLVREPPAAQPIAPYADYGMEDPRGRPSRQNP